MSPGKSWRQALGHDQRLWKTVLNKHDLAQVLRDGVQPDQGEDVDQALSGFLYLAHDRNHGTLSRRADLLRLASLLVLAFVIVLSAWLPSQRAATSLAPARNVEPRRRAPRP
jgi:hypothetical protein